MTNRDMPSLPATRVIKLGGSLLDWPQWPAHFRQWLQLQPQARNILVAGGGALADDVRRRDQSEGFDPSTAHWLAIDAMSKNAAAARQALSESLWADRWEQLQQPTTPATLIVFCARDFLEHVEPHVSGPRLPHSWDVTSDSIAARLADVLGAQELMLLKSALPPPQVTTLQQAAEAGFVDRCFPQFARNLASIRCCNLRCDQLAEWVA